MKNLNFNKKEVSTKKIIIYAMFVAYSLVVAFIFYAMIFTVYSSVKYPGRIVSQVNTEGLVDKAQTPELLKLESESAFLNARLKLVNEDSVCLTINLVDSLITLEQKGVVLHSAKISNMAQSRVFQRIDPSILSSFFASPLSVQSSFSTIPKIKYNLKVAPSDTTQEVILTATDTIHKETVCYRLGLDQGIILEVRPVGSSRDEVRELFDRNITRSDSKRIMQDLFSFRVPEYRPVIQIELSDNDARTIYKALPVHAWLAIKM